MIEVWNQISSVLLLDFKIKLKHIQSELNLTSFFCFSLSNLALFKDIVDQLINFLFVWDQAAELQSHAFGSNIKYQREQEVKEGRDGFLRMCKTLSDPFHANQAAPRRLKRMMSCFVSGWHHCFYLQDGSRSAEEIRAAAPSSGQTPPTSFWG